jgi:hypothetical protein
MRFGIKILAGLLIITGAGRGQVIESFEAAGSWTWAPWQIGFAGTIGTKATAAAYSGSFGLSGSTAGQPWYYRTDVATGVAGNVLGAWVRGDQRNYFGFGATSGGGWSLVLAPNTSQLIIQQNASWGYADLVAAPVTINTAAWYYLQLTYNTTSNVTGRLFNSAMVQQASVTVSPGGLTNGGISLRIYCSATGYFDNISMSIVLPIELVEFKGVSDEASHSTLLSWTTGSEKENKYFSVERSLDGENFQSIGIINGAGNSTGIREYSYVDEKPFKGINYYRLQQVDFNGNQSTSRMIDVDIKQNGGEVMVFPTVSSGAFQLQLPSAGEHEVAVRDLSGQLLQTIRSNQGGNCAPLDLSQLGAGCYIISGQDKSTSWSRKVFVAK